MANKTKAQRAAEEAAANAKTAQVEAHKPEGDPVADAPKVEPAVEAAKVIGAKVERPAGVGPGRVVLFHRSVNTGTGTALISQPGIVICDAAPESNLPPGSVDIMVFTRAGSEVRFNVMPGLEKPEAGKWSWPVKA